MSKKRHVVVICIKTRDTISPHLQDDEQIPNTYFKFPGMSFVCVFLRLVPGRIQSPNNCNYLHNYLIPYLRRSLLSNNCLNENITTSQMEQTYQSVCRWNSLNLYLRFAVRCYSSVNIDWHVPLIWWWCCCLYCASQSLAHVGTICL